MTNASCGNRGSCSSRGGTQEPLQRELDKLARQAATRQVLVAAERRTAPAAVATLAAAVVVPGNGCGTVRRAGRGPGADVSMLPVPSATLIAGAVQMCTVHPPVAAHRGGVTAHAGPAQVKPPAAMIARGADGRVQGNPGSAGAAPSSRRRSGHGSPGLVARTHMLPAPPTKRDGDGE